MQLDAEPEVIVQKSNGSDQNGVASKKKTLPAAKAALVARFIDDEAHESGDEASGDEASPDGSKDDVDENGNIKDLCNDDPESSADEGDSDGSINSDDEISEGSSIEFIEDENEDENAVAERNLSGKKRTLTESQLASGVGCDDCENGPLTHKRADRKADGSMPPTQIVLKKQPVDKTLATATAAATSAVKKPRAKPAQKPKANAVVPEKPADIVSEAVVEQPVEAEKPDESVENMKDVPAKVEAIKVEPARVAETRAEAVKAKPAARDEHIEAAPAKVEAVRAEPAPTRALPIETAPKKAIDPSELVGSPHELFQFQQGEHRPLTDKFQPEIVAKYTANELTAREANVWRLHLMFADHMVLKPDSLVNPLEDTYKTADYVRELRGLVSMVYEFAGVSQMWLDFMALRGCGRWEAKTFFESVGMLNDTQSGQRNFPATANKPDARNRYVIDFLHHLAEYCSYLVSAAHSVKNHHEALATLFAPNFTARVNYSGGGYLFERLFTESGARLASDTRLSHGRSANCMFTLFVTPLLTKWTSSRLVTKKILALEPALQQDNAAASAVTSELIENVDDMF